MKNLQNNSMREFKITFFDREDVQEFKITFDELIGINQESDFFDTEMRFSLLESLDDVLNLKPFERMSFLETRGDKNSLSIIIRVQ
jgi:vesicle coat complex subunit